MTALRAVSIEGPKYAAAYDAAEKSGGQIRPEAAAAYEAWKLTVERLKQRIAQIIESNPQISEALDATGTASMPVSGFSMSSLEAYFGELAGPAADVLDTLKNPLFTPQAAAGVQGLSQLLQAASWAARVAGPVWAKMVELLSLPLVRSAVVTTIVTKGVGDALNADTVAFSEADQQLNSLVAEGKLTVEQAQQLKPQQPSGPWGMLAIGAVVLGGGWLYLRSKKND